MWKFHKGRARQLVGHLVGHFVKSVSKKIERAASKHTVDGSEIPFPTTVWMYKTPKNDGINCLPLN